ncbi:MAG: amidohydrolase family protein, partial [Vulcanimicrobiaceae bacterium]
MKLDLVIRNGLICGTDREPFKGSLGITGERIAVLAEGDTDLPASSVIDASGRYVLPGMIDPHIHIGHGNPHREEFWSEGCSAIMGGVTSMFTYYRRHPFNYLELVPKLIEEGEQNAPI